MEKMENPKSKNRVRKAASKTPELEPPKLLPVQAIWTAIQLGLAAVGLLAMYFWHHNLSTSFAIPSLDAIPPLPLDALQTAQTAQPPSQITSGGTLDLGPYTELVRLIASGVLAAGVLICTSYLFSGWFGSFAKQKAEFVKLFGRLPLYSVVHMAVVSALAEEILFRGAIQPAAGVFLTSVFFALLHLGPGGMVNAWTWWTGLAGLLLGYVYDQTGSLYPTMLAHFAVNFYSLLQIRGAFRTRVAAASQKRDGRRRKGSRVQNSTTISHDHARGPHDHARDPLSTTKESEKLP